MLHDSFEGGVTSLPIFFPKASILVYPNRAYKFTKNKTT